LDVQSTHANAFSEDDISVLQILTDQVAVAVDNARSYGLTQKAVDDIREADRLKSQFLANMSHELRTPLNSIIGFSRVILKGIDGPINELQQQDLTAIYNSGQHLLGLINDVLDLSKIEAGKMELAFENDVNLTDIIKGVMSTTIGLVKDKQIELRYNITPELPLLRIDPMKVRQVLLNLMSNAAKFTEEGFITIDVAIKSGPDERPEVVVSVIDTGPGIAPEDQRKLFQPFSQVDGTLTRKTGGSGLGLSICNHLIHMHGGRIGLTSKVGEGSTFYFTLLMDGPDPIIEIDENVQPELPDLAGMEDEAEAASWEQTEAIPPTEPDSQASPADSLLSTNPERRSEPPESPTVGEESVPAIPEPEPEPPTADSQQEAGAAPEPPAGESSAEQAAYDLVLAVDKDPQVVELYKRYLANHDYTVITLTELEQVVTVARGIQPFVITLDVTMHGAEDPEAGSLDGWQVLKSLKADPGTRNIPVIICTIVAEQEKAFRLGAADYLLKPILEEDLARVIHRLREKSKRAKS
jgi:signal transduction histidine kinase/CheY-like chemotaxis protein